MKKLLLLILLLVGCATKPTGYSSYYIYDDDQDGVQDRFLLEWAPEYIDGVEVQKDVIYEDIDGLTAKVYVDIHSPVDKQFSYTLKMYTSIASSVDQLEFNKQPFNIDYPLITWQMDLEANKVYRIVITSDKDQTLPFVFS